MHSEDAVLRKFQIFQERFFLILVGLLFVFIFLICNTYFFYLFTFLTTFRGFAPSQQHIRLLMIKLNGTMLGNMLLSVDMVYISKYHYLP